MLPLNFDAEEYFNLISWEMPTEPAATMHLSDEEIMNKIKSNAEFEALKLPCHTQAVERHIKLVTGGEVARDGFIRARLKSRESIPKYETKKEFFNSFDD